MAIKVFFIDLRDGVSQYMKFVVDWYDGMEAVDVLNQTLRPTIANRVADDLAKDNPQLIVSWYDSQLEEHSGIGGVGSLDWEIEDESTLTVIYEDEYTTDRQIDESSEWMLENAD